MGFNDMSGRIRPVKASQNEDNKTASRRQCHGAYARYIHRQRLHPSDAKAIFVDLHSAHVFIRRVALAVGVKVRDKESRDRALRRFKRSVNRSGVLRNYRQNMAFTKPSEERRVAREKAFRNARKHSRRY